MSKKPEYKQFSAMEFDLEILLQWPNPMLNEFYELLLDKEMNNPN